MDRSTKLSKETETYAQQFWSKRNERKNVRSAIVRVLFTYTSHWNCSGSQSTKKRLHPYSIRLWTTWIARLSRKTDERWTNSDWSDSDLVGSEARRARKLYPVLRVRTCACEVRPTHSGKALTDCSIGASLATTYICRPTAEHALRRRLLRHLENLGRTVFRFSNPLAVLSGASSVYSDKLKFVAYMIFDLRN